MRRLAGDVDYVSDESVENVANMSGDDTLLKQTRGTNIRVAQVEKAILHSYYC